MKYLIHAETTTEYEADAELLKQEFPAEYRAFLADGDATDVAWVEDCWDNGGPELFRLLSESHDVQISQRSAKPADKATIDKKGKQCRSN